MRASKKVGIPANKEGAEGDISLRRDVGGKTSIFGKINGIWQRAGLNVLGTPSNGSFALFRDSNKIHHDSRFAVKDGVPTFRSNLTVSGDIIAKGPVSELVCIATDALADAGIQLENSADGASWSLGSDGSDSHKFKISKSYILADNPKLTIDNDGNVGIGDTDPPQALSVVGNILLQPNDETEAFLHTNNKFAISSDSDILIVADSNDTSGDCANDIILGAGSAVDTNNNKDFTFADAYPSNVPRNEFMRIQGSSGNVGIGDNSPSYKLDVDGTGRFTGDLTVGGDLSVQGGEIDLTGVTSSGMFKIVANDDVNASIELWEDSDNDDVIELGDKYQISLLDGKLSTYIWSGSAWITGCYVDKDQTFYSPTVEFGTLTDSGESISITKFVDEADGIGSNDNDTTIPTSAAIKDYVDTNITAQDLDISDGSSTIAIDLDSEILTLSGNNPLTSNAADNGVTFSIADASTSAKGAAQFSSDNFAVSSGTVTIKDNGVILGTETTGNYVATVTAGTGLTSTGATSGESIAHSLSVDAAQTQITSVGALDGGSITSGFGNISIGSSNLTVQGDVQFQGGLRSDGDFDFTNAAIDIDLIDNNASALSFDTNGKAGILEIVTTNSSEKVKMSGGLDVTGVITSAEWQGDAIAHAYIANDAIEGDNLADNAVDSEHYTDGSIDHVHLAGDAVEGDNIANDSIDSEHYVDASIDFAHIQNVAANSILGRNANSSGVLSEVALATTQILIGNGTGFTAAALSGDVTMTNAGVVTIGNDKIDSQHYADGSIDTAHIADAQITFAKLADAAVQTSGEFSDPGFGNNDTSLMTAAAVDDLILSKSYSTTTGTVTSVAISDGSSSTAITSSGTFTFSGTSNETTVSESGGTVTIGLPSSITANVIGDLTGSASKVSVANSTADTAFPIVLHDEGTAGTLKDDTGAFTYNPSSAIMVVNTIDAVDADFDGTLEADAITVGGTALNTVIAGVTVDNATNAAHVSVADNESTNENNKITFIENSESTGNVGLESDGDFHYNPSAGLVTASSFSADSFLVGGHSIADIDIGSEFVDTDDHVMSSGAIKEKIESYGYLSTASSLNINALDAETIATGDELVFSDIGDNGIHKVTIDNIAAKFAGDVATSGLTESAAVLYVDIHGLNTSTIASGDYIAYSDEGTTNDPTRKDLIDDVATLFAGTGLTASSAVISIDAAQTGITSLLATDIKIGEDDQTKIDFETADEIHFYAANVEQVYLADNIFGPQTDSDVDLGTTGVRWKDAYIDTITTTGDIAVGGDITLEGNGEVAAKGDLTFICDSDQATSAGNNKISFQNGTGSEVASIDEDGNLQIDGDLQVDGNNIAFDAANSSVEIDASAHNVAGKDLTLSAGDTTAGTTANIAGGDLILEGGQGKGTGVGGGIYFKVAQQGSSGSVINSLATAMTIEQDKDVLIADDLTVTGNINGSSIWQEWVFNVNTGVANRYYYRDQDDLDDWRRWDDYSTLDGSSNIVITTQFVSGHFVVPENCTLKEMQGQIYNAGSTSCPTVSVFSGTPSDSSSLTASSRGYAQPNSGSALTSNENYTFSKTDFDYDLAAGDIVLPTVHYTSGSLQSYIGCLTLKFITR